MFALIDVPEQIRTEHSFTIQWEGLELEYQSNNDFYSFHRDHNIVLKYQERDRFDLNQGLLLYAFPFYILNFPYYFSTGNSCLCFYSFQYLRHHAVHWFHAFGSTSNTDVLYLSPTLQRLRCSKSVHRLWFLREALAWVKLLSLRLHVSFMRFLSPMVPWQTSPTLGCQ